MSRLSHRSAYADSQILRLINKYGSLSARELGDMLRRECGMDFTPSELGKRISISPLLRRKVARKECTYWEPRGQLPRTDSIYSATG